MAAPTPAPPRRESGVSNGGMIPAEWPVQAAGTIVDTIGKVRDKTTRPAIVAARTVVYGLVAVLVGSVAAVLTLVLIVRLWANYVPGHVWVIYAIFFAVFSAVGLVMLRKANAPGPTTDV